MKKSLSGTTIIESIIVMLIVVSGIIGVYKLYANSMDVTVSTSNRIQAIAIAREGIEAMVNIRDTNWKLFSANTNNCWFTLNYDASCITQADKYIENGAYKMYQDTNNRWILSGSTLSEFNYSNSEYRDFFRVNKDDLGLYTQSGGTNFFPIFTREIKVTSTGTSPQSAKIQSIVKWTDSARKDGKNYEIILETELTNWKK